MEVETDALGWLYSIRANERRTCFQTASFGLAGHDMMFIDYQC
jgi:hypothetical protein